REVLPVAQRPEREEERQQQRHDRAPDDIERRAECARGVERDVDCARAQHQDDWEHHGEQRDAEARHVAGNVPRELRGNRVVRGECYAWRNPRGEDLAGPIFASWIAPRIALPADNPIAAQLAGDVPRDMPGFGVSLFTVVLPVILMLCASAVDVALDTASTLRSSLDVVGSPIVALLLALLFSFWSLGYRQHFTRDQILKFANDCLAPTAAILLVIGAGGGFNRVLLESGVGKAIADVALGSHASPLLLAWTVAALIRVATGSATVAMTTSAGIVTPIAAATPGTHAELLVL